MQIIEWYIHNNEWYTKDSFFCSNNIHSIPISILISIILSRYLGKNN